MAKMVEYFDRLPTQKRNALRAIAGGELDWHRTVPRLSSDEKAKFIQAAFGCGGRNLHIQRERNHGTGYDIPIIVADEL